MRYLCLALLFLAAWPLAADDNFKVIKLEADVRDLQERVRDLSRQLEELKQQLPRAGAPSAAPARPAAAPGASTTWLDAGNWNRVHPGMSEFEVISVLGVPTSMRTVGGERRLLYATEIGSSGFLTGSVTLREGKVTGVAPPVLK